MKKININLSLKLIILFVIVICLILVFFLIKINSNKGFKINVYNNDGIKFNYDNTFRLTNNKKYIELVTTDNSAVVAIKKIDYSFDLDDDNAESIAYQITLEDGSYNKVFNELKDGKYYYLYENYEKEKQIEIIEYQKEDYLYLIVFEADSNEFDLYEESFNIIINSFKV